MVTIVFFSNTKIVTLGKNPAGFIPLFSALDFFVYRTAIILINKFRKDGEKKVLESVPMGNLRHAYLTTIGKEQSMDDNWEVKYRKNLIRLPDSFLVF